LLLLLLMVELERGCGDNQPNGKGKDGKAGVQCSVEGGSGRGKRPQGSSRGEHEGAHWVQAYATLTHSQIAL
jgi:hypothetical protein